MKFKFKPHIIDTTLPDGLYGQTAAADLDGDGNLEFITGQRYGDIFCYKYESPEKWSRFLIGEDSPSDVGGCVLDVNNNGLNDYIAGGAWYKNNGNISKPFKRFVFDEDLTGVHDITAADINNDGEKEIITMSDKNSLRWYKISDNPESKWEHTEIGPAVHAGVSIGDIDGDGDLDVVRTNVWFENVKGDGSEWKVHHIGPNTPPPSDFNPTFSYYATESYVCDMSGNGKTNDIVFTDAEIPGGKIWWMENLDGSGTKWKKHMVFEKSEHRRGAYHSLYVGDLDNDGDLDILSCEMEGVPGEKPPRWYIWENLDGKGKEWKEHVILDENLGGHEIVAADFTGNGKLDIIGKPWNARENNAVEGKTFVVFLENVM